MLVLKLRCNKRSVCMDRPTSSSNKKPHFETRTCLCENKHIGHGLLGECSQEYEVTVQVKISRNLTDRPTVAMSELENRCGSGFVSYCCERNGSLM
jgi:hypothetical protein